MNSIVKLFSKIKGNVGMIVLTVIALLALVIGIFLLGGLILVFGLNLMGFAIPYTLKTAAGGAIVISCLRSIGGGSKEK